MVQNFSGKLYIGKNRDSCGKLGVVDKYYLKSEAKLHNAYAGRTADLSTARLTLVGQLLADKVTQAQRAARLRGDTFVP